MYIYKSNVADFKDLSFVIDICHHVFICLEPLNKSIFVVDSNFVEMTGNIAGKCLTSDLDEKITDVKEEGEKQPIYNLLYILSHSIKRPQRERERWKKNFFISIY